MRFTLRTSSSAGALERSKWQKPLRFCFSPACSRLLLLCAFFWALLPKSTAQTDLFSLETYELASWRSALRVEGFAGPSVSFALGDYISDYQNSFAQVSDPEGRISGGVYPRAWFSAGAQVTYAPFAKSPLSNLYVGLGLMYHQRGFRNRYRALLEPGGLDYRDNSIFVESYTMHMLSLPLIFGWGRNKWFGEIGVSGENMVYGLRSHRFTRSASGADAYEGGFSTASTYREKLSEQLIDPSAGSVFILSGGKRGEKSALRLMMMVSPRTFYSDPNFRNLSLHIQWQFPLVKLES